MSTHNHNDNHGNNQELVESSGIKAKPILIFLGALAAATALVFVIIRGVEFGLKKVDELDQKQPATQLDAGRKVPAEPRLQGAPEPDPDNPGQVRASKLPLDDMAEYRKQIEGKAAEYEWVDKQGGIARIPIERAKELIAEKGLPSLSATAVSEIETAEKTRREVYNSDSNAGRGIKSAKPAAAPKAAESAPAVSAQPAGAAEKTAPTPVPVSPAAKAAAAGKH